MGGAEAQKQGSWFGRHKVLTTIGAVVLLLIVVNIAGGGGDDEPDTTADEVAAVESPDEASEPTEPAAETPVAEEPAAEEPVEEAPAVAPGIGTPVRDGKFEFVVNSVTCGETQIGDEYFNTTAQGNFCFVAVTVTNIGDEPQSFWGDGQSLYNAEGQEYSADTEAAFYMEDNALYEEINPGNSLSGTIVYDVPVGTVPASIELHDSIFSGGVTVALL